MDFDLNTLRNGLLFYIVLVCSLCIHEWAHAFMADRLGDDTPRHFGRGAVESTACTVSIYSRSGMLAPNTIW